MLKSYRGGSELSRVVVLAWFALSAGLTGCPPQVEPPEPCEGIGLAESAAAFINDAGLVAGDLLSADSFPLPVYERVLVWDAVLGTHDIKAYCSGGVRN